MSGANGTNEKKPRFDASGKQINDYIPYYIAKKPWYYESEALASNSNSRKRDINEGLEKETTEERFKHQRVNPESESVPNNEPRKGEGIVDEFDKVGETEGEAEGETKRVTKDLEMDKSSAIKKKQKGLAFKAVCGNCGSSRHRTKECLEKPRKIKFKYRLGKKKPTRKEGDHEYLVRKESSSYDEKRDRWHGFDAVNEYDHQLDEMKKREKKLEKAYGSDLGTADSDKLDDDEMEELRDLGLLDDAKERKKEGSVKMLMENNPLAAGKDAKAPVRSLDDKPRYLEVIKTGEELRFNPKSRVYKDLKEGYLNDRGQFIPYLNGEAEEFEKMKQFTHKVQEERQEKWENGEKSVNSLTNLSYTEEASPTAVMLAAREEKKKEELLRQTKRNELLLKYGALGTKND
ncbi:DEKNAAC105614 [Brettanomyces naardenensis]|uniref:Pre-mRNA-splicing factor SLU7 n=1 Tax=Brettanomyces naardenensis TaxID=13370 RepID=A0A448YTX5_BRENA|nr:DEKNAAC105614 [Brettanomyces naardenensis]